MHGRERRPFPRQPRTGGEACSCLVPAGHPSPPCCSLGPEGGPCPSRSGSGRLLEGRDCCGAGRGGRRGVLYGAQGPGRLGGAPRTRRLDGGEGGLSPGRGWESVSGIISPLPAPPALPSVPACRGWRVCAGLPAWAPVLLGTREALLRRDPSACCSGSRRAKWRGGSCEPFSASPGGAPSLVGRHCPRLHP